MNEQPKLRIIKGGNKPARKRGKTRVAVRKISRLQRGGLQSTHIVIGGSSHIDEEE